MKISNKINLSFFVVASLIAITASFSFYSMARDSLQKLIRDNLAISVSARARQVETYLDSLSVATVLAAKNPVLGNALAPAVITKDKKKQAEQTGNIIRQANEGLAAMQSANPAVADFLLLDGAGKVVAASNEGNIGQDKSGQSYFNLGKKGTYLSDIYFSDETNEPILTAATPLFGTSSQLVGMLIAHHNLNGLNTIMTDTTGLGKTGEIYLVNQFGYMVSPSRLMPDVVLKQLVDSENYKRALARAGKETVMPEGIYSDAFPNYRGAEVLGDNDFISRMNWSVLAELETSEAYAPLTKLQLILLMILLLAPLAAWLLGEAISRTIAGPLHRLYQGVQIINSGNLDYRLNSKAKDEVGELARAFDTLAQNLKKSTGGKKIKKTAEKKPHQS
jgi:HAMP domain-containing protein